MAQGTKNTGSATRILCDMGRTRIQFALAKDDLSETSVKAYPTDSFGGFAEALTKFCTDKGIDPARATLAMSVPAAVIEDEVIVSDIGANGGNPIWRISKAELLELGLQEVVQANDMVAAGLGIPIFHEQNAIDPIAGGRPAPGYPITLLGVRTGLGAMALVQSWAEDRHWIPVQAAGGHISVSPNTHTEHNILHAVRRELEQERGAGAVLTVTAQDILAGRGVPRLYRATCQVFSEEPDRNVTSARALSQLANMELKDGSGKSSARNVRMARIVIEFWCRFFGTFARNMALAYGASGGVYAVGQLPMSFLSLKRGNSRFRQAFRASFEVEGPDGYLVRIPRVLVTHPFPYLAGIGRINPQLGRRSK